MSKYKGKILYESFHSNDNNSFEGFKKTFAGKDIDHLVWEYQRTYKHLRFYNFQRGASLFTLLLIVPGILLQIVNRYDDSKFGLYLVVAGLASFGLGAYYWARFSELDDNFMHPTLHAKLNALKAVISDKVKEKHNGDFAILQPIIEKHKVR